LIPEIFLGSRKLHKAKNLSTNVETPGPLPLGERVARASAFFSRGGTGEMLVEIEAVAVS
jgi:hypothetical protein